MSTRADHGEGSCRQISTGIGWGAGTQGTLDSSEWSQPASLWGRIMSNTQPLFPLGRIVAISRVLAVVNNRDIQNGLNRHMGW